MSKKDEALKKARDSFKKLLGRIVEQGGSGWKLHAQQCVNAINAIDEEMAERPAQQAAIKTLKALGYTYHGAELWKPPLSKPAQQEHVVECDCETATSPDGSRLTRCGSDQMRRAVEQGHAFCKQPAQQQEPKKDLMYSTVAMQERHAAFVDRAVATLEQVKREELTKTPI